METQLLLSAFNTFLKFISGLTKILIHQNPNYMDNNKNQGNSPLTIIGMIIIALFALFALFAFFALLIKL